MDRSVGGSTWSMRHRSDSISVMYGERATASNPLFSNIARSTGGNGRCVASNRIHRSSNKLFQCFAKRGWKVRFEFLSFCTFLFFFFFFFIFSTRCSWLCFVNSVARIRDNSLTKFFLLKKKTTLPYSIYIHTRGTREYLYLAKIEDLWRGRFPFARPYAKPPTRAVSRTQIVERKKERKEGSSRFNPPSSPCLSKRCPTTRLERVVRLENRRKNRDRKAAREISVSPTRVCISMHTPRGILIGMR